MSIKIGNISISDIKYCDENGVLQNIFSVYASSIPVWNKQSQKLLMKCSSGNIYEFDPTDSSINRKLQYCSSSYPYNPITPYSNISELQTKANLIEVIDTKGEINSVGNFAFKDCSTLSSIDIPNVTSIGYDAFENCSKLISINCPNVNSIGPYAFYCCRNLSSISCPNVSSIEDYVFDECSSLISIDCSEVTSFGEQAFAFCSSLISIDCPNIRSIGQNAFACCPNLSTINCPNVSSIKIQAFYSCSKLSSIDCPNVSSIEKGAFKGCQNLSSIVLSTITDTPTTIGTDVFDGCTTQVSVYVHDTDMVEAFKTAENWKTLFDAGKVEFISVQS